MRLFRAEKKVSHEFFAIADEDAQKESPIAYSSVLMGGSMDEKPSDSFMRRSFIKGAVITLAAAGAAFVGIGCAGAQSEQDTPAEPAPTPFSERASQETLPPAKPDPEDQFGVDININMENIDDYLNREDVIYRDMRLFIDPADFGSIGGDSNLPDVLEGFKITPLPYLATLPALPVEGGYDGPHLLDVTHDEENNIMDVKENYLESMMVIEDLFPKDMPIFLSCGGAGYSAATKALLIYLGWDADKIYVIGPMWCYKGKRVVELIKYPEKQGEENIYMLWRADYVAIDFELMHKLD